MLLHTWALRAGEAPHGLTLGERERFGGIMVDAKNPALPQVLMPSALGIMAFLMQDL